MAKYSDLEKKLLEEFKMLDGIAPPGSAKFAAQNRTIAFFKAAFSELLHAYERETEVDYKKQEDRDAWWAAMPSWKVQKRSGPFAQAKTEGRDASVRVRGEKVKDFWDSKVIQEDSNKK